MTGHSAGRPGTTPSHVAIIMDGNGRWAAARGLPRTAGHRVGARALTRIVEAAAERDIDTLTVYAFSADNWQRPPAEVAALMKLFRVYLLKETARCVTNGIRLTVLGRRDRLAPALVRCIESAEAATQTGTTLHLRVAVDYSARDAMLRAARRLAAAEGPSLERFGDLLGQVDHDAGAPDVDLMIRTGGEQRLSDFLLWECAYAELHFSPRMWPDFGVADLDAALADFASRERRFGSLTSIAAG